MEKLNKITELENTIQLLNEKLIESNHESLKSMTENTNLISDLDEKKEKVNLLENKMKEYEKKIENFQEENSELKKEKEDYEEENKKLNLFIEEINGQIKKSIPEGMDLNELTQEYEGLKE